MIGEIRQNFTEASASVGLILATALVYLIFMLDGNVHSEGTCVFLEIPSMHKLVQYFWSLYGNEDIYELKGVHIANFEVDLLSSSLE